MDAALQLMYKDNRVHLLKTAIDWKGQGGGGGVEPVEPTTASTQPESGLFLFMNGEPQLPTKAL